MNGENTNERKRREELELIHRVAQSTTKAVVTGPAGARLWGIKTHKWVKDVDLVLPGTSKAWGTKKTYKDRVYRSGDIAPEAWTTKNGVRVARGIRCLYDALRYHGRMEALVEIESARFQYQLTTEQLLEQAETLPNGRGIRAFRELIAYSGDLSASPLETIKRDALLRAIADGRLTGVESLEFQIGFDIADPDGSPTTAWADMLVNGFIAVEADGLVKKDGTYGDLVPLTVSERHREVQMQNHGAVFVRTGWHESKAGFIARVQTLINLHPGVRQLPNRREETYREYLARIERDERYA